MNTFDVMVRPTDAAAVLDAYAAAVNSISAVEDEPAVVEVQAQEVQVQEVAPQPVAQVAQVAQAEPETATGSMARLLEIAARNADQLMVEARAEAESLTATARVEAGQVLAAARAEAGQLRAESLAERARADQDIAGLRQVENDHRDRLRDHLQGLLERVDGAPEHA